MKAQASILVGRISGSSVQKVCVGSLYAIGATFPLTGGMTPDEHDQISRAARFLHGEKAARSADLACGYRVSLF